MIITRSCIDKQGIDIFIACAGKAVLNIGIGNGEIGASINFYRWIIPQDTVGYNNWLTAWAINCTGVGTWIPFKGGVGDGQWGPPALNPAGPRRIWIPGNRGIGYIRRAVYE